MHMIEVGLNYLDAPLWLREKFIFTNEECHQAAMMLKKQYHVHESVIIVTCNRTEIFAVVEDVAVGKVAVQQFLQEFSGVNEADLLPYVNHLHDDAAVKHLFKLAVGLESMVIGETQILGQVKQAFFRAQEWKMTGTLFNELFKRVITFAKRMHHDMAINQQAVSVSYIAVTLAKRIFGDIKNKHVVILGAGETGKLTMQNLISAGVTNMTVVNRSFEKAQAIAKPYHAQARGLEQLADVLLDADILISSTGANQAILDTQKVQMVQEHRQNRPLFLIDLAVPRDIDQHVSQIENVFLFNMDDLHREVTRNKQIRQKIAVDIESQLGDELAAFQNWVAMLAITPVMKALREKTSAIQQNTLQSIYQKMPNLTTREKKVLQKHTKSIVNQILEAPIHRAKELAMKGQSDVVLEQLADTFGLNLTETVDKQDDKVSKKCHLSSIS